MPNSIEDKYRSLLDNLRAIEGVAVAFSGGVDSTFLLAAAHEALPGHTMAVIARSPSFPRLEEAQAVAFAEKLGVPHRVIETQEMDNPDYRANPPDRCYHCKSTLFTDLKAIAGEAGMEVVIEGSNVDDRGAHRPGRRAIRELGIRSPLAEAELTKDEIRQLSKKMDLPTWNKPSMACLASRVPYGQEISVEKLARIEVAEAAIRELGIEQVRVRDHGDVARVEVAPGEIDALMIRRQAISSALKEAGYLFVAVDLDGYRTGAMNEGLAAEELDHERPSQK